MTQELESIIHAISLAGGISLGLLGIAHRGQTKYDTKRQVHVSQGTGLAAKIAEKHPTYKKISPIIDHIIAGIGVPAFAAGYYGFVNKVHNNPQACFNQAVMVYILAEIAYELYSTRNRRRDSYDTAILATDVITPLLFLYAVSKTLESVIK